MPMTYLHTLDDDSPLAQYKEDIRLAPGNLLVWVQGYDEVLKTSICNRSVYPLRACAYGRWRNIIQRGAARASTDGAQRATPDARAPAPSLSACGSSWVEGRLKGRQIVAAPPARVATGQPLERARD